MSHGHARELSCSAKIARVVLDNCGPLSPPEVADEAYISEEEARDALEELADGGLARPVCGVCDCKEEVYELTATDEAMEPSP